MKFRYNQNQSLFIQEQMHNPISTYRIQFHKDFTFSNFREVIPYLHQLGVKTIYASPILEASPGSMHGYDTVNPLRINPEIGDEEQLLGISSTLKSLGMQWIQDIVPNHMAYHENNLWLMDVLENGSNSEYYDYFDINWSGDKNEPIMTPFLGKELEEVVQGGELQVVKDGDKFKLDYFGTRYPLSPKSQKQIQQEGPEAFNKDAGKLLKLANSQHYRLCSWKETDRKINYRRFFTVNSLICLNIHHKDVFRAYHKYILTLLTKGVFQGLRVDHIDGLFDPTAYLNMLREAAGEDTYIVIEKILEEGENMPLGWPIEGTTGYDFLATVNNLLTNRRAEKTFSDFYHELTNYRDSITEQIYQKKRAILKDHMAGELDNLVQLFLGLDLATAEQLPEAALPVFKEALAALLVHCPVYRYYGEGFPLTAAEETQLKSLLKSVEDESLQPALKLLKEVWIKAPRNENADYNERAALFYKRFMQFSGPLMAKGVEDTLMYTYNRFIGKNEVGDSPDGFGKSPETFHEQMLDRQQLWPMALNGTSTHDTKRGEDARARLHVLTDLHEEWLEQVKQWQQLNAQLKPENKPDENDEYFIYQTVIATHPMPGERDETYQPRMEAYLEKAFREAKRHTGWADPAEDYEAASKTFANQLLAANSPFQQHFASFHKKVADFGILNSLTQVLLKFTCPGLPDVYQGTELWDFSFVDPDNRRPVDYAQRAAWLADFEDKTALKSLWEDRYTGRIKLWLEHTLLGTRQQLPFSDAAYIPLEVSGQYKEHILAFARRHAAVWMITVVPLHVATLCASQGADVLKIDWKNTRVSLPEEAPSAWLNLLDQQSGTQQHGIAISDIFSDFPLAVLKMQQPENNRGSGILMHITSLPSAFGIGDLGPQAHAFVDALSRCNQKYWQLLPMNPVTSDQSYSPYSSISSKAGNELLISPVLLAAEGLLTEEELKSFISGAGTDTVNYPEVQENKSAIYDLAYACFKSAKPKVLSQQFLQFCKQEADWLDDFVLFTALRRENEERPWNEWPTEFRRRNEAALSGFRHTHREDLNKAKWLQFIFFKQWKKLRKYAAQHQVKLFGDLPFYISYDSADVWAHPHLFKLDEEGNKISAAGVPPDYFNEEGQLWGMPIYKWDVMAKDDYSWWQRRLKKNMELYDLLRLDHFRAFSSYWEVPAEEETAINGTWVTGPGAAFFEAMNRALGRLPFVAEDLGDITDDVYALRDQFNMPGMKVLQFAFGDDMPFSIHIPHQYSTDNCVVYTGTHDNNTTKGWYKSESSKLNRQNMNDYIGSTITKKNVSFQLMRLAFASTARLAIIPIQDILGLGKSARMNTPSSTEHNWGWIMKQGAFTTEHETQLRLLTRLFGRF
jgi:malto-oligosyltrehalose synthase/4-alpha-glucanotransferase